ncbi:MAG: fused MFS/spermidine synthase [Polyangiaceae bacterium]|nr:fused MFS/spermidine synthase [Polyangiaceae bacterium]
MSSHPHAKRAQQTPLVAVALLFVASGAAGLVDQVCFSKYLTEVVGATAQAVSAVLAAFMTGLALGAHLGGRFSKRAQSPLRAYGVIEIVVAIAVALSPVGFALIEPAYVALARLVPGSIVLSSILRWAIAMLVVIVPTTAMGATLPLLARLVEERQDARSRRRALGILYAANTLGGAMGALGSAYVVLPALGLRTTTLAAALTSGVVGIVAILLGRRGSHDIQNKPLGETENDGELRTADDAQQPAWALDVVAFASGALVLACEVLFTHLLVLVVGTSAYAFGLIVFIFLVCLFFGASLAPVVERFFRGGALALGLAAASFALFATLPVWDMLPGFFRGMGSKAATFEAREFVRATAAFVALVGPTTLMGLSFPLLLQRIAARRDAGVRVGRATAINTVGSVFGSLVAGYVLLPAFGSQRALLAVAFAFGLVAVVVALTTSTRSLGQTISRGIAVGLAGIGIAFGLRAPAWNLGELTGGYHVYFDYGRQAENIVYVEEEVQGGVTTVEEKNGVHTLLTNGKFQGNDGDEVHAQRFFAHYPVMFTPRLGRALVIGLGTGTTLGTIAAYPFEHIDVAEISPAIVKAARKYFGPIGASALDDGRVSLHIADGRNHLLLSENKYDLVGIELTSVWFAGASSLYSREFYQLVKSRLADDGILQQWIQLHHIYAKDLATVLRTLRLEFAHVVLFYGGGQGILVASNAPLVGSRSRLDQLQAQMKDSARPGRRLATLHGDVLVTREGIDAFIADAAREAGVPQESLIATDDNLVLEYSTPRGNVLSWMSREEMVARLVKYRDSKAIAALMGP